MRWFSIRRTINERMPKMYAESPQTAVITTAVLTIDGFSSARRKCLQIEINGNSFWLTFSIEYENNYIDH